jgi:hypothetical protein
MKLKQQDPEPNQAKNPPPRLNEEKEEKTKKKSVTNQILYTFRVLWVGYNQRSDRVETISVCTVYTMTPFTLKHSNASLVVGQLFMVVSSFNADSLSLVQLYPAS